MVNQYQNIFKIKVNFLKGGKCSICGESYSASPKLFEKGGQYYTGKSVKTYKKGQTIDVHVEVCFLFTCLKFYSKAILI
jgi:hypothetical protein